MRGMLRDFACGPTLMGKLIRQKRTVEPRKVAYGPDRAQYLLDFVPPVPQRETVVVYLHGGGWNKGSPTFFSFIGQRFAREGYRCLLPGYRLVPKARFPAQLEDVTAGTRAALKHLEREGISTDRVVVVGSSAGAQLGALLCYSGQFAGRFAGRFAGFIGLGGPYRFDLEAPLSLRILSRDLLGDGDPRAAQPGCLLDEHSPKTPMLLIHGLEDGVVGFACGADFHRRALELDIPARLYLPETGKDSHSDYVVGCFLERRENCETLDILFRWMEELP